MFRQRFLFEPSRKTFLTAVMALIGHLAAAALVFVAFILLAWIAGLFVYLLDKVHPFAADVLSFITMIEMWFVYLDVALCAIVLLAGTIRFARDVVGEQL